MNRITLSNLLLGLDDLLTTRIDALKTFEAGVASVTFLTLRRDKIAALPPELTGRALADELSDADTRHDGSGSAIWFLLEGYLRHPDTSAARIEAAKKIRSGFIPTLDALRARNDVEAKVAKDHEPLLETLKTELMMFPVNDSETLYDWASGFIANGKKIDALLSQRADSKDRKDATALRSEVIAKLNRLREDLVDALKDDSNLSSDLETLVFGYFDLLEAQDA